MHKGRKQSPQHIERRVTAWKENGNSVPSGEGNPNWKGGVTSHGQGYLLVTVDGKQVLMHRKVMSDYLGRPLLETEIVHHKNGDKRDNRIENLELTTRSQHIKHHMSELLSARALPDERANFAPHVRARSD